MTDCECDIVQKNKRILYVEPNDIYGKIDGVPITPDYSDYCISVNLIAEVVSRFKQSGDDLTKKYIISWSTKPDVDSDGNPATANNWISFLLGQDAQIYGCDGTLLTTYYTDINYDDVSSLRLEARQKLEKFRPTNIGQASRIGGVNPADVSVLIIYLDSLHRGTENDK